MLNAIILSTVILLLSGCDTVIDKINDIRHEGTTIGYQNCLERNKNMGIANYSKLCKLKHEGRVSAQIDGRAGYKYSTGYFSSITKELKFSGYIKNSSLNVVVTSLSLSVAHNDNLDKNGNKISELIVIENIWVEPEQTHHFSYSDLKFKPTEDRLREKNEPLYTWNIAATKGIKISLK